MNGPVSRNLLQELDTPQDLRVVVLRMLKLLDALEKQHRVGIVQLDICPGTIQLAGSGQNETLQLIPCPGGKCSCLSGYAAPEAVSRVPENVFAADLYSVAAVFFHCLMGRKLTLTEVLQSRAPDGSGSPLVARESAAVQEQIRNILRRGLDILPERRYGSIGVMRSAFLELLHRLNPENDG